MICSDSLGFTNHKAMELCLKSTIMIVVKIVLRAENGVNIKQNWVSEQRKLFIPLVFVPILSALNNQVVEQASIRTRNL